MDLENFSNITLFIFAIAFFVILLIYSYRAIYIAFGFGNKIRFKRAKKNNKFAILVPARNESKVIGDLLEALQKQVYSKNCYDVFVIVKEHTDPTIDVVKQHGYNILVDENQTCKGEALDTAIKYIYKNNLSYDAFLIFDADNIPNDNFLFEINKAVDAGYDIGMGYRNSKNWDDGWIASCSGLTFSLINTCSNKARTKIGMNCVFSGTGYFIKESVLNKFKSWPFKTLTEDYEISLYAIDNNLKTTYVEKAEYYDEQPVDFKTSFKQRVRWVKGFIQARSIYIKNIFKKIFTQKQNKLSKIEQCLGVFPLAGIIVLSIAYVLFNMAFIIWGLAINVSVAIYLKNIFTIAIGLYLSIVALTIVLLLVEHKRIKMSFSSKLLCCLTNPIFMTLYVPIATKALFSKKVGWDKIEHTRTLQSIINDEPAEALIEEEAIQKINKE